MTPQREGEFQKDPALDSLLDEVVGGRTPPDLTERIMSAWSARQQAAPEEQSLEAPPIVSGAARKVQPPPVNGHRLVELPASKHSTARERQAVRRWPNSLVAIGTTALAIAVCVFALNLGRRPELADRPEAGEGKAPKLEIAKTLPDVAPAKAEAVPRARKLRPKPVDDAPQIAEVVPPASAPSVAPSVVPARNEPAASDSQVARDQPATLEPATPEPAPAEAPYQHRQSREGIVTFVNAELARSWSEAGVTPAAPATDAEWCRRLYVRILGRTPTAEELAAFTKQKNADRREKLAGRLLTDSEYAGAFAQNWAGIFTNVLLGRTGGGPRSLASREEIEKYFRAAILAEKPYDEMVSELLTATGSAKPGTGDYNPAVNFLLDGLDAKATLATARVARVFLGTQLQCAQCHVHPTQDWSQEQYWSLNSFFRQMKAERGEINKLTNGDFAGEGRNANGAVFFETPSGILKSAFPKFVDGTAISQSGKLDEVDRRAELAALVVKSDRLPRALVNRVWSHFFGYGFTSAADDVGQSATHEALLDRLADQFVAHDFDLKALIQWVALSDPFSRSSKLTDLATKDMPEAGEVALFSRYYLRPMQPEEVVNSLVHAAQIRSTTTNSSDLQKARVDWLSQFHRNMGTDDGQEESHFSGVRQSLMMMNGDLMRKAVSSQQGGLLKSLAGSEMPFEKKVEHLFLSSLARQPSARELRVASTILTNSKQDQAAALEDIWWAILNSNEFILDH